MKKFFLFLLSNIIMAVSCSDTDDIITDNNNNVHKNYPIVVLQKRNPALTTSLTKKVPFNKQTRAQGLLDASDYIGRGYVVGNSFIGEAYNVSRAVIDLDKLKKDIRMQYLQFLYMKQILTRLDM